MLPAHRFIDRLRRARELSEVERQAAETLAAELACNQQVQAIVNTVPVSITNPSIRVIWPAEEAKEQVDRSTRVMDRLIEARKKDKGPKIWTFDIDETITAAPVQFARLATALRATGDKIVVVTGHGPKSTRQDLLDELGFPYDEIIVVDPGKDGKGKAKALKALDAFFHFDDRIEFGPEIIKICPVTFQYVEPPGDDQPKKDAKKAKDALAGK